MVPLALATDRPELARGGPSEHLWAAVHRGADPTEVWQARLRDAHGPVQTLRVLLGASRVNPDHLALRLGHAPSKQELREEWRTRWGRGLRRLPALSRRGTAERP